LKNEIAKQDKVIGDLICKVEEEKQKKEKYLKIITVLKDNICIYCNKKADSQKFSF
jgi:hypothetical protein